jgi:hypothetical protein
MKKRKYRDLDSDSDRSHGSSQPRKVKKVQGRGGIKAGLIVDTLPIEMIKPTMQMGTALADKDIYPEGEGFSVKV